MPTLTKHWQVATRLPAEVERSLQGYPFILCQILYNRGHATAETARQYLEGRPPAGTDPLRMKGMPEAVERLSHAIRHSEAIAVYGDYDADGVTATALLVQALTAMGANVREYIPNRFDEGYGLNSDALGTLKSNGVQVVITVDCGIRSLEEAERARQLGIDLIISDHHHPGKELPGSYSVINPKQSGDLYPDKDLAGVGLAYKLACALFSSQPPSPFQLHPSAFLDLVAIGTVADLAPLSGENRALVRAGLKVIRQTQRQGLFSLMEVAGLAPGRVTAGDIGFIIGPRLNAAGRLDTALAAYELLTTEDVLQAGQIAQRLEVQNRERQQLTRAMQARAEELALAENPDALLLFAAHPDFNPGVVWLAASRLSELYYRPAIVAQIGETFTRGSCRSIAEFHITKALDYCADLLEHHGGHAAAAGFTISNKNLPAFIERMQSLAAQQLGALDLRPTLFADIEIPLSDLKAEILAYLEWLQPTGYGNREAMFVSRGLQVKYSRTVGKDNSHLKLTVSDGRITYDAIAFRQGHWQNQIPRKIDLMYAFEKNEFNGQEKLQLNVRDIKPSGTPD